MTIPEDQADQLRRLRAQFTRLAPEEVRELLRRAFPLESRSDEGALKEAEELFTYLQLRARWSDQVPFSDCIRPIEQAVRTWFEERHIAQ